MNVLNTKPIRSSALLARYVSSQCWPGRVGVERSKVQVQFRDISYQAEVLIGSSGLPSVGNSFKKLLQVGVVTAVQVMLRLECHWRATCICNSLCMVGF